MRNRIWKLCLAWLVAIGCGEQGPSQSVSVAQNEAADESGLVERLNVPAGFDFSTVQVVELDLKAMDRAGGPLVAVPFRVYRRDSAGHNVLVASGATDEGGVYRSRLSLPSYLEAVRVEVDYIGLPSPSEVPISNGRAFHVFGGVPDRSGLSKVTVHGQQSSGPNENLVTWESGEKRWDIYGLPEYLEPTGDVISSDLLSVVNASVPEGRPVPQYHPDYLSSGRETNIRLTEEADIWVTFVHEGAGYKNVLGYYTYETSSPPVSVADITNHRIILPNVSYQGSGGRLFSGDKVYLGRLPAGTTVGWFLLADGFRWGAVSNRKHIVYSDKHLNPESDPSLQQHNIILDDPDRQLFLLSFEDILRDNPGCDNDFNDAVFYVTANPYTAVATDNFAPIDTPTDSDSDGVSDVFDSYPSDPDRAFNQYFPGEGQMATLAYEDLWPQKGDYDFNDLVVDYSFTLVTNVQGEVADIEGDFRIRAIGAAYRNGFAIELPTASGNVATVTGSSLAGNILSLSGNGVEAGPSNAVVVVFDDASALMSSQNGSYVNTEEGVPYVTPSETHFSLSFVSPVTIETLPPYDPFIIVNQERGRELHLPGKTPTDLADGALFDSLDDASGLAGYYRTATNLPWALHLAEQWRYPKERTTIPLAYPLFEVWAESAGQTAKDWYVEGSNSVEGYLYTP